MKTGGQSISASGENGRGIKFLWNDGFDDAYVGSGTNFIFNDGSKIGTGKSVAKAWMVFDGNDGSAPAIRESYNIHSLTDNGTGKYTITFVSGVLAVTLQPLQVVKKTLITTLLVSYSEMGTMPIA